MDHVKLRGPVWKSEECMKIHQWVKKKKLASRMKLRTYQAGKKIESRVEKDSVKVWELDSYNSDVYIDSLSWVRYRWIAQLIEIHWNIIHAHLLRRAFFCLLMVVNFPSADWLSDLRTQLKVFVGWVCLRSKRFFLMLFSRINFFVWSRHFKELQLKGNLFDCPQNWTVARLTYKKPNCVCELFISKYFFSESEFRTITSHFYNPISKMFCNFLLQLNMAKRRHAFLVLFVLKPRKNKLVKNKICFDL